VAIHAPAQGWQSGPFVKGRVGSSAWRLLSLHGLADVFLRKQMSHLRTFALKSWHHPPWRIDEEATEAASQSSSSEAAPEGASRSRLAFRCRCHGGFAAIASLHERGKAWHCIGNTMNVLPMRWIQLVQDMRSLKYTAQLYVSPRKIAR